MNLHETFKLLVDLKVKYIVTNDWAGLPFNPPNEINILCESISVFIRSANLSRIKDNLYELPEVGQKFRLYEKGNGFLPVSFELELLSFPVLKNDISIPSSDKAFWLVIYMIRYYCADFNKSETYKTILADSLSARVGPARKPLYSNLNFTL